jgi:hypothetical protein
MKQRSTEYTRYIESNWDVSKFVDPFWSGGPARALDNAYFGVISKKDLAGHCDAGIRIAHAVLAMIGTTGDMSWGDRKRLFGLISEGARRELFSTDELDEVLNLLFDARQASPSEAFGVGAIH